MEQHSSHIFLVEVKVAVQLPQLSMAPHKYEK
jgi:hypothetical protein